MLILSRKIGESIVLNDDITLKVISVDKGVVKLGIDAPKEVSILRSELLEAVESANKSASSSIDTALLQTLSSKLKK